MAKRIVEKTLANGEKRYSVQKNTIWGIPYRWRIMTCLDDDACICHEATFDTIDKAIRFCGLDRRVVNSKVLKLDSTSIKCLVSKEMLAVGLTSVVSAVNAIINAYFGIQYFFALLSAEYVICILLLIKSDDKGEDKL